MKRSKPLKRTRVRRKAPGRKLIEQCDSLMSKQVFERDGHHCIRCGRPTNLTSAHVLPKGKYPRLRWVLDNLMTLCWLPCHESWWHKNPMEAAEWFTKTFPERWRVLQAMKDTAPKVDVKELLAELQVSAAVQDVGERGSLGRP